MSFITGAVGRAYTAAVLAQLEDEDGNPLEDWRVGFWSNGEWRSEIVLEFKPVALSPSIRQSDSWVVLGIDGEVLWINSATTEQALRPDRVTEDSVLPFTTIHPFDTGVAVAQMGRRVYWSDGIGWQLLGTGLPLERPDEIVGFEGLAARDGELYACGWGGEIWFLHGRIWRQVTSPTNVILTSAQSAPTGEVIICGRLGTILRGWHDRWVVVDHGQTDEDFWSVTEFQGRIYISSLRGIYELVEGRLEPVDDSSSLGSYYHLSANDTIMLSVGARGLLLTDGQNWQQIL